MAPLAEVWSRLSRVGRVTFDSHSEAGTGWDGRGVGTVRVSEPEPGVLVFDEAGTWSPSTGSKPIIFTNVFRWTRCGGAIQLEHLRFGPENPVFLFELSLSSDDNWRSVEGHVCGEDCYAGMLSVSDDVIRFEWTVTGPRKRETIQYVYA